MPSPRPENLGVLTPGSTRANLVLHLNDYDWATAQYRSTNRPLADIANDIGVSRSRLFDYFSREGISRDLSQQIAHRREQILAHESVDMTNGMMPTDDESVVAINATMQAILVREHRQDIRRMRLLALALLNELEQQTITADWFEDLGTILRDEDEKGRDKLNDVYKYVISTPGRTESLKKLAEVLKILITLERQAFGMREDYEDLVIRKGKLAAVSTDGGEPSEGEAVRDHISITKKFMQVLESTGMVVDANVKQTQVQPAPAHR